MRERGTATNERGFTLIELMVALLVLSVVMVALLPDFFTSMRATTTSNSRSTGNGLAVAATEQIRAIPYYRIGYSSSTAVPAQCQQGTTSGTYGPAVIVDSGTTALLSPTTTQVIGGVTYTVQRCLYWVASSNGDTNAFKQSVVTVSWSINRVSGQVVQSSAIYPGGESAPYAASTSPPGEQNFTPPAATPPPTAAGPPLPPTNVTATVPTDPNASWNTIYVGWTPPSSSATPAANYIVEYQSVASPTSPCPAPLTSPTPVQPPEPASASPLAVTLSPSTSYCFQVLSVAADGTRSTVPSNIAGPATTTAQAGCQISNLTITNYQNNTVVVNSSGQLVDSNNNPVNGIALQVQATSQCANMSVGYTIAGSTVYQATMSGIAPTLSGTAGTSSTVWATGNHTFTVYITDGSGLHGYNNGAVQQLVYICQESGQSGKCAGH